MWWTAAVTLACEPVVGEPEPRGQLLVTLVARGCGPITDLQFPPSVASSPPDADLIVLVKDGRAYRLGHATPWLVREVRTDSEMGLLGLAFAPDFPTSRRVYLNENPRSGRERTRIVRLTLVPFGWEIATDATVLQVDQPYENHNAGQLAFGPDGMLYVGLGDGGAGGDPHGHGQNLGTLLGSMLRLDVSVEPYRVPPDNPFVSTPGARPEIWAYGLRNPWRFSWEGDLLVVADVGQDRFEEIDLVVRGGNYGWNVTEGRHCFQPASACDRAGLTDPIYEYGRETGMSITGGYADAAGHWFFADFVTGRIFALDLRSAEKGATMLFDSDWLISTFGRDHAGRIYVADYATGDVYRIARL